MTDTAICLAGRIVRLEPLGREHIPGLTAASDGDRDLYRWSLAPAGAVEVSRYVDVAIASRDAGSAIPFAIVRQGDNLVIGSTRFWNLERWGWPSGHDRNGREFPDACEIDYTWLTPHARGTGANIEAKLLMLEHAFEQWGALRVCFHADRRNERSRAALERIGATFEGVLRAHRIAVDFTPRDSYRYSIVRGEWASIKTQLKALLPQQP